MIADVPMPLDLKADESEDGSQSVVLRLRARNREFEPLDNASVSIDVQPTPIQSNAATSDPSQPIAAPPSVRIQSEAALS